jgi:dTDP-glucose 4,6-dehydratase
MHLETLWLVKTFPMNIIRPSNAYAPAQLMYRILPRAVYAGLTGKKLPLQGGGLVKKSFMHAYDLAQAIYLIIKKAPLGSLYNVGPDNPVTMRYLVELVAQGLGIPFDELVDIAPGRVGEDAQYWLDSTKIKSELGYKETITIEQGVQDMINWGKKYIDILHDEPANFTLRA